jgi:hypothetical protein
MTDRISFIEIELKKCSRVYGVAPCTASVGVTGTQKCFNTRVTCQDKPNLNESPVIVRYSLASTLTPVAADAVPNVESIDYTPPVIDLGKSLGERATLTVRFKDHRSPDTDPSGDPYIISRTYDPWQQGSYWGKFKARHPFIRGQKITWVQGTPDQSLEGMERRTFVVESMVGPDSAGNFTIIAKDVLKLADGDRSVCPKPYGRTLDFDISPSFTGNLFSVSGDNPEKPALLDGEYLAIGESEIVKYTTTGFPDGGLLVTVSERGQLGTIAVEHKEDATVQSIKGFVTQKPSEILRDLLVDFAGVDPSFISLDDWENEADNFINRTYTAYIARPTAVKTLINELLEQTASSMWWDNQAQQVRWQVLRLPSAANTLYTDDSILRDSLSIADQPQKRVSQVWVSFGLRNPLAKLDDPQNYTATTLRTELQSEDDWGGVPAYKSIFSRWIPPVGKDIADRLGDLILQRFSLPPRKVGFRLMRDSGVSLPDLAASYNLQSRPLQLPDGSLEVMPIQVTSLKPMNVNYTVVAEEIRYNQIITPEEPNVFPLEIATATNNYNIREQFNQFGIAPDSTTIVNVTVFTGVIVGSTSVDVPAMVTGSWPSGVTINIINRGFIVGRGGRGGQGGRTGSNQTAPQDAEAGQKGGDALVVSAPINMHNTGVIGGGGGGAGGGGSTLFRSTVRFSNGTTRSLWVGITGNGGSGGAGSESGDAGLTGFLAGTSTPPNIIFESSFNGQAGSLESGGARALAAGAVAEFGNLSQTLTYAIASTSSGQGGTSGALGQSGTTGTQGISVAVLGPDAAVIGATIINVIDQRSNAGTGGAAGRAIVGVSNIAFTNAGDIRGAQV